MQSQVPAITDLFSKSDSDSPVGIISAKEVRIELDAPRIFLTFKSKIFDEDSFSQWMNIYRSVFLRITGVYLSNSNNGNYLENCMSDLRSGQMIKFILSFL